MLTRLRPTPMKSNIGQTHQPVWPASALNWGRARRNTALHTQRRYTLTVVIEDFAAILIFIVGIPPRPLPRATRALWPYCAPSTMPPKPTSKPSYIPFCFICTYVLMYIYIYILYAFVCIY